MLSVTFAFLQAHVQKLETTDMLELGQRLVDSKICLAFLIECVNFSPADIRLNKSVFQWYGRMGEIFDEHRKIIKEKTELYQEFLKVGIIDFSNCSHFFFLRMFGFLTHV
jgi:dynein heavy chain